MPTLTRTRTPAPRLDLDARLALTDAAMTLRLETAAVAHEVNTAHIPAEPAVVTPTPGDDTPTAPAEGPGPIARVLADAVDILAARGWAATGPTCRTRDGRLCLAGAIRVAAGCGPDDADSLLAARAASFLLDTIRQTQQATTLPSWNDAQRDGRLPTRMLRQAAALASALGI